MEGRVMNIRKPSWLVTLLVFVMALGGAKSAAAAPVGDHLPETRNPTSARFDIAGSIDTSGGTVPISGQGAISGNDFMLDMELTAPAGASGPDSIGISLVVVGSNLYLKMTGLSEETDGRWYVTDASGLGMEGMDVLTGIDLETAHDSITITGTAKEAVNGAPTTRYDMEIDTDALMPQPLEDEVSIDTTATMSMWIGESNMYVHKMTMAVESVATVGETTSFVRVNFTVTLKDFDTPITIAPPANAEPITLDFDSALEGLPLGGVLGGLPGMGTGMGTGMPRTGSGEPASPWPLTLLGIGAAALASGVALRRRAIRVE
jgi:hypothetical protein